MVTVVIALGLASIVGALFCVTVAGIKNRDLASWFLLGAVLPVPAAIAVCLLAPLDDELACATSELAGRGSRPS
jgi:hypothetical protein